MPGDTERVLVIAPHPDDETLGCGGTLLRHIAEGRRVDWLLVTNVSTEHGWPSQFVETRQREIDRVAAAYGFDEVFKLDLPTTRLDTLPVSDIVTRLAPIVTTQKPAEILLPYRHDVHSDHRVTAEAAISVVKSFRQPSVRRVSMYETPSETDFAAPADTFKPNVFVDVTPHFAKKLEIFSTYVSEVMAPPGPRSPEAIEALARTRGARANCRFAEAFELLFERR